MNDAFIIINWIILHLKKADFDQKLIRFQDTYFLGELFNLEFHLSRIDQCACPQNEPISWKNVNENAKLCSNQANFLLKFEKFIIKDS